MIEQQWNTISKICAIDTTQRDAEKLCRLGCLWARGSAVTCRHARTGPDDDEELFLPPIQFSWVQPFCHLHHISGPAWWWTSEIQLPKLPKMSEKLCSFCGDMSTHQDTAWWWRRADFAPSRGPSIYVHQRKDENVEACAWSWAAMKKENTIEPTRYVARTGCTHTPIPYTDVDVHAWVHSGTCTIWRRWRIVRLFCTAFQSVAGRLVEVYVFPKFLQHWIPERKETIF